MKGMSPEEVRRAVAMWGLAMCLLRLPPAGCS